MARIEGAGGGGVGGRFSDDDLVKMGAALILGVTAPAVAAGGGAAALATAAASLTVTEIATAAAALGIAGAGIAKARSTEEALAEVGRLSQARQASPTSGTTGGSSRKPGANGEDSTTNAARNNPKAGGSNGKAPTPAPAAAPGRVAPAAGAPAGGGAAGTGDGTVGAGLDRLPHGAQLWQVDGSTYYLAYTIPGHDDVPLVWRVENPDRLSELFGTDSPTPTRKLSKAELNALAPWQMGGISTELALLGDHPFDLFLEEFNKKAELRPWINDPSFLAVSAIAYLEGRDSLTADELASTDFYNRYTDEQRAWMERSVTASDAELESNLNDAMKVVSDGLRAAGMANPPEAAVRYIATQRITGNWSEMKAREQTTKLADPFAPGQLEKPLWSLLRDPDATRPQDLKAMEGGFEAVMARVRDIFEDANVAIATDGESEQARLSRIASEIMAGGRTWSDLYGSIDRLAALSPGGRVGGIDVTSDGEEEVRQLVAQWVGPYVAQGYDPQWVAEWAGRLRNDPDAQDELISVLQQARLDAFPEHTNPNARYVDIVAPARSLFTSTWGQAPDEMDPLFLDVLRQKDYLEAQRILRKEGINRGVTKVTREVEDAALAAFGGQVRRSSI